MGSKLSSCSASAENTSCSTAFGKCASKGCKSSCGSKLDRLRSLETELENLKLNLDRLLYYMSHGVAPSPGSPEERIIGAVVSREYAVGTGAGTPNVSIERIN